MDRRQFSRVTVATLATRPIFATAQERPVEGTHFVTISPRQATRDPKQVEVLEFFAYGCSHCDAFEPAMDAWQKKLPAGVLFRRIPVAFREVPFVMHQKLIFFDRSARPGRATAPQGLRRHPCRTPAPGKTR